jgi:hypothetical protein
MGSRAGNAGHNADVLPNLGPVTTDVILAELGDWRRVRSQAFLFSVLLVIHPSNLCTRKIELPARNPPILGSAAVVPYARGTASDTVANVLD